MTVKRLVRSGWFGEEVKVSVKSLGHRIRVANEKSFMSLSGERIYFSDALRKDKGSANPVIMDKLGSELESIKDHYRKIQSILSGISNSKIRLNDRTGFHLVDPKDIIYCEADGSYSTLYLKDNLTCTVTMPLGGLLGVLPEDSFIRINRSVLANIRYLYKIDRKNKKCLLKANGAFYEFCCPINNIRLIEKHF